MSEGNITVPRLGVVESAPGFRLVAAMNPFDAVGTARISSAVYDRVCRIAMTYQSSEEETAIVSRHLLAANAGEMPNEEWVGKIVEVVRRTRSHTDLRFGSSIRGAIDAALVAASLSQVRGAPITTPSIGVDSALVALTGRVRVREGSVRSAEEIVVEIWGDVFGRVEGERDSGKAGAPTGATNSHS